MKNLSIINDMIQYIEDNLTTQINMNEVANQFGYSYFHITKLFKAVTGESLGSYICKRRLALAARDLLDTKTNILDIGLTYGYNSAEGFTRSFKELYHMTPYQYRRNQTRYYMDTHPLISPDMLTHLNDHCVTEPRIIKINDIKIVGIRDHLSLLQQDARPLWESYNQHFPIIPDKTQVRRDFCVCETLHNKYTKTNDLNTVDFIGTEVNSFENITKPLLSLTIPAGDYAVFTHTGSLDTLQLTYTYIWGVWAFATKLKLAERNDFELYTDAFKGYDCSDSKVDIYIPILQEEDEPASRFTCHES